MKRRFVIRQSEIHGRGVFAKAELTAGERLLEYAGRVISPTAADRLGRQGWTDLYQRLDGRVIDPSIGGNSMRYLNHSCAPNCFFDEIDGRVFVFARCRIEAGAELTVDYHLRDSTVRIPCRCGARNCRGTQ
jgi:uncharacterized protein